MRLFQFADFLCRRRRCHTRERESGEIALLGWKREYFSMNVMITPGVWLFVHASKLLFKSESAKLKKKCLLFISVSTVALLRGKTRPMRATMRPHVCYLKTSDPLSISNWYFKICFKIFSLKFFFAFVATVRFYF